MTIYNHPVWPVILVAKHAHHKMYVLLVMLIKTKDFKEAHVFVILDITHLPILKVTLHVINVPLNVITVNIMLILALFVTLLKIKLQDMTMQED